MTRWPDKWIVVCNWPRFQERRERPRAPWIKLYLDLLHKSEWLDLSLEDQGLLANIWLMYADGDGRLRLSDLIRWTMPTEGDPQVILRKAHHQRISRGSARLNHAGFIAFSNDKPLPLTLKSLNPVHARDENSGSVEDHRPCPFCEIGGGRHAADCPTLDDPQLLAHHLKEAVHVRP